MLGTKWVGFGRPVQEQLDEGREYLTYEKYCAYCKQEGDEPVGKHRFQSLMSRYGLVLAPQDLRNKRFGQQ